MSQDTSSEKSPRFLSGTEQIRTNYKKHAQETSQVVFTNLLQSAVIFFERAIATFDDEIDASIVHFATSLELTLKAQLALEHWAFIFNEMKDIDLGKLDSGRFSSIRASSLVHRINMLRPSEIGEKENNAYNKVFEDRNKVVHYVHSELTHTDEINKIKITFLNAWYYLHYRIEHRLLAYITTTQRDSLYKIFKKMSEKEGFWSVIYDNKKENINKYKDEDGTVLMCPRCSQRSLVRSGEEDTDIEAFSMVWEKCFVCKYSDEFYVYQCPNCSTKVDIRHGRNEVFCPNCTEVIIGENSRTGWQDDDLHQGPVYCESCGENTFLLSGGYYCSNCQSINQSFWICDICSTAQTGSPSSDYAPFGCPTCKGRLESIGARDRE